MRNESYKLTQIKQNSNFKSKMVTFWNLETTFTNLGSNRLDPKFRGKKKKVIWPIFFIKLKKVASWETIPYLFES